MTVEFYEDEFGRLMFTAPAAGHGGGITGQFRGLARDEDKRQYPAEFARYEEAKHTDMEREPMVTAFDPEPAAVDEVVEKIVTAFDPPDTKNGAAPKDEPVTPSKKKS